MIKLSRINLIDQFLVIYLQRLNKNSSVWKMKEQKFSKTLTVNFQMQTGVNFLIWAFIFMVKNCSYK